MPPPSIVVGHPIDEVMGLTKAPSASPPASRQKKLQQLCPSQEAVRPADAVVLPRARETTPSTEGLSLESPTYSRLNATDLSFDMDYLENIPTSFRLDVVAESISQPVQDITSTNGIAIDAFMQFIGDNNPASPDHWLINTGDCLPERPTTPIDEEVLRGYQKMAGCHSNACDVYDPNTPLYYILNRVKALTGEMATKNVTPFIHQRLYRDYRPQCVISCFTACVLYSNRTPTNTAMVIRALSDSARELVDTEACRTIPTPIEKLARSQTLFLYQVIRLFDGDVSLRAQGEKDMGLFRTWLRELCYIRDNLGDLARLKTTSIRELSPIEWEKWIFAECLRRTVILAYSVIGLYEILKDPAYSDPDGTWAYAHRWTLGRSLWEASSPAAFQRAWKQNPHFVITNFNFEHFLEVGKSEDVDEFSETLLHVYMGVDAMKDFMAPQETKRAAGGGFCPRLTSAKSPLASTPADCVVVWLLHLEPHVPFFLRRIPLPHEENWIKWPRDAAVSLRNGLDIGWLWRFRRIIVQFVERHLFQPHRKLQQLNTVTLAYSNRW
ncbi:hypothetical protein NUW58_g800 [Xylaria curta]|uniref:Uncharacterized protein n=1 Tax=Xylaria curta TaxID=42375 RepID=A0ACC1PP12_9PEZI|nr:hypothetical protein NUW58_g800 [Xylaria curta]